ncbi:MAG TPA: hypothetical protein VJT08_18450 [Terriglobales bacterium]|nr:hypothetical protein [Terriglobales bacterium]
MSGDAQRKHRVAKFKAQLGNDHYAHCRTYKTRMTCPKVKNNTNARSRNGRNEIAKQEVQRHFWIMRNDEPVNGSGKGSDQYSAYQRF